MAAFFGSQGSLASRLVVAAAMAGAMFSKALAVQERFGMDHDGVHWTRNKQSRNSNRGQRRASLKARNIKRHRAACRG